MWHQHLSVVTFGIVCGDFAAKYAVTEPWQLSSSVISKDFAGGLGSVGGEALR